MKSLIDNEIIIMFELLSKEISKEESRILPIKKFYEIIVGDFKNFKITNYLRKYDKNLFLPDLSKKMLIY
jgi:hypothetical protein